MKDTEKFERESQQKVLNILCRFLKNNNCYHLWRFCAHEYKSGAYNLFSFFNALHQNNFPMLITCAPFVWSDATITPIDSKNRQQFFIDIENKQCLPNNASFWNSLGNEWEEKELWKIIYNE